jgi:predicted metal-dependent hydrolase
MPVGEAHRRRDARRAAEGQCRRPALARLRLRDIFGGGPQRDGSPREEREPRRVALAGVDVEYVLVRVRRRSIGMEIGLSGLTVRAPRRVSVREIEATLAERAVWILRSLAEWKARRRDVLPREWKTGAPILYLGRELTLAVHPARKCEIAPDLLNLTVLHPSAHDERAVAAIVARWLRDEAVRLLAPRVAEFAVRVTPTPPVVKLSNARSEWGNCNQKGVIRLNWRLVQLPPELALYVIAHEVAHLVELNHSARFWNLVETLLPGHASARRALDDWTALLEA